VGTVVAESLTTRRPRWVRIASWLAVADLVLFVAPVSVAAVSKYEWRNNDFQVSLTRQLRSLGAANGDTQCLDTFAGCLAALDEVGIRQSSGFLYDCYLFSEPQRPATLLYRERFWNGFRAAPPRLLVMTDNDCFSHERSFDRLKRWSLFADYVDHNYTEILQYTPSRPIVWWRHPQQPYSYRVYLHKVNNR
jgi:hypothetical protein